MEGEKPLSHWDFGRIDPWNSGFLVRNCLSCASGMHTEKCRRNRMLNHPKVMRFGLKFNFCPMNYGEREGNKLGARSFESNLQSPLQYQTFQCAESLNPKSD